MVQQYRPTYLPILKYIIGCDNDQEETVHTESKSTKDTLLLGIDNAHINDYNNGESWCSPVYVKLQKTSSCIASINAVHLAYMYNSRATN